MAFLKTTFRGLNTDEPVNHLKSGTARESRNVIFEGSLLQGRFGFDQWVANVGHGVLKGCVVEFASRKAVADGAAVFYEGECYTVLKADNGELYYANVWDGSAAVVPSSWTALDDRWEGHNTSDHGHFFTADDRLYYFDRKGGTKWSPTTFYKYDSASDDEPAYGEGAEDAAWKAGIASTKGALLTAASGGAMNGFYRVAAIKKDSRTRDTSIYPDPAAEAVETRPFDSGGGFTVHNWTTGGAESIRDDTSDLDYEWDTLVLGGTMGASEQRFDAEAPSFQFFPHTEIARTQAADPALGTQDETIRFLSRGRAFANAGGTPPGCRHVAWNGQYALYGNTYDSSGNPAPGQLMYSLPRHPAMVPGEQTYAVGDYVTTVQPRPWVGMMPTAISGRIMGIGCVGSGFLVFTQNDAFSVVPSRIDGRLRCVRTRIGMGAVSESGVVSTSHGAHALGTDTWVFASSEGARDVADDKFASTLLEIPAAQRANSILAACPFRNEVWAAVARETYDCTYLGVLDGESWAVLSAAGTGEAYSYDWQLFPDAPAAGDGVAFIFAAVPTGTLTLAVNRPATYLGSDVVEWVYWDGDSYETLTITSDTTNPDVTDGTKPFVDDGTITFTVPDDITSTTVGTQTGYVIMARIATGKAESMTQVPILTPTGPTRILIFDEARGTLTSKLDPRTLCGATIGAMWQHRLPTGEAKMMIGLSDGRILSWPSANYCDTDTDGTYNYSTEWTTFIGQERRHREMLLDDKGLELHVGRNARNLRVTAAGVDTGGDAVTDAVAHDVSDANCRAWVNLALGPERSGAAIKVTFSTTASALAAGEDEPNSPDWQVIDLLAKVDLQQ